MSNSEFKFKQFTINQSQTAMKVGTDGVLLGAWTSCNSENLILDIGTGTGLIALMLAQKSNAKITAIDINKDAFEQAILNFENSIWKNNLECFNVSFQDYSKNCDLKYDLIVSNPPYFSNSLKNINKAKSEARHNDTLLFEELVLGVQKLSHKTTRFNVILPFTEKDFFTDLCLKNLMYCNKITTIKPNFDKPPNRILMQFSQTQLNLIEGILIIENNKRHCYTEDYINMTKDYYLKF